MSAKLISEEGSALVAELFQVMTMFQKNSQVPDQVKLRIGEFMVANGYRTVFGKWYKQAEPVVPQVEEDDTQELKGFCVVQITKAMLAEVLESKADAQPAARAIGYLVASAIHNSPYQPCEICRIEIVEGQQS